MPIQLPRETEQRVRSSIKRFFSETMEEEIGELRTSLVLDFCLKEICPSVYNQAIADAQAYLQDRMADLDSSCFHPEFGYWDE